MKIKLPCEIVTDLLPSYIDGLTSEKSTESVNEHLRECEKCRTNLEKMKKDFGKEKQTELEEDSSFNEDKNVIKKINKKINKRVKLSILIGLVSVVLITLAAYILYNEPMKKIDADEVEVTAKVYGVDELVREYGTSQVTEIKDGVEKSYEETTVTLLIPDSPMSKITMSAERFVTVNYLTIVSWKSPYHLNVISYDTDKPVQENVKYVDGFRTTFFNNQSFTQEQITCTAEFEKIDEIIYVHENGSETVLWENEEE